MKPVTIVLPTYCPDVSVSTLYMKCTDALFRGTPRELFELIIVDNGGIENGGIDRCDCDLFVRAEEPLGFSRAVNIGYRLARTEYICVLNNDVFVPPGWLELMLRDFTAIQNCGILAPSDGPQASIAGPIQSGQFWTEHWGSLYLTTKRVLDDIGVLDEDKLAYRFQDQDQSIRCHKAGYGVYRTSSVVVEHVNSATYSKMNKQAEEAEERAEMIRRYGFAEFNEWVKHQ